MSGARIIFFLAVPFLAGGCASVSSKVLETPQYNLLAFQSGRPNEKFPLLIALHGRGQTPRQYLQTWKDEAERRRIMILAPRIEDLSLEKFDRLIGKICKHYPANQEKLYLAGVSAGALVAREILIHQPARWKAVILVAAPDSEGWIERTDVSKFPPILFVHGEKDNQFKITGIVKQVELLKQKGVDASLIRYPNAGHEHRSEWNPAIFDWIEKPIK